MMQFGRFCHEKFTKQRKSLGSIGFEAFKWQREVRAMALPGAEEAAAVLIEFPGGSPAQRRFNANDCE